jgi:putative membrane protein
MSDAAGTATEPPMITARVIELDLSEEEPREASRSPMHPQVIATARDEPIVPKERASTDAQPAQLPRRRDRVVSLGAVAFALFVGAWLAVDAIEWVAAAFGHSTVLGTFAAITLTAGLAGAGAIIARELGSLLRLQNVETVRRTLSRPELTPPDTRRAIADVLAVVPREGETVAAIEAFQRQSAPHHKRSQQVELLSRIVIKPLDQRAEAHVRTAVVRAFGITAISPTALTDAAFFLACGLRMVRGIAAAYGHRPTIATTAHLLRRLLLEAGKLGAVDIASASLVQHLGGAVTERLASSAAEALYAAYRMARLGIIVMDICRPTPFAEGQVPSVTSLVRNVLRRRPEGQVPPALTD